MKKNPEYDSKRQQNVLLERMYSDVHIIAEGHGVLVRNMGEIKGILNEYEGRFDRIETVVTENSRDIKALKVDVSGLKSDVTDLKSDVTDLKSDVTDLKSDVTDLKSDVSGLKSDVSGLKSDVSTLKSDVTGLKSDVSILKSDVTDLKSGQERIEQKLDLVTINHEQRIQKLEAAH